MLAFWGVLALLLLVACNGFFVAAEFALVSVRRTRVQTLAEQGNLKAQRVLKVQHELDFYIAATQLGITMASLGLGFVAEPAIALFINSPLEWLGMGPALMRTVSFAIAFSLATCLHIVLGELAPKTIALQRAEAAALNLALPLMVFARVFKPVIYSMNWLGNHAARLFGSSPGHETKSYSPQELMYIVSASSQAGEILQEERDLLENVLEFRGTSVRNIMVNRTEMVAVPKGASLRRVVELRKEWGYSRYPVYERSLDDIVGFIHVADILYISDQLDASLVEEIMHPPHFVPESMRVGALFSMLKHAKVHQAVVVDEYGGTAGLVTMEDVVEEIVGEIYDESDAIDHSIREVSPNLFAIEGQTHITDVEDALRVDFKTTGYESIGGLISGQLGRIPAVGEIVELMGWRFMVTRADARAVRQVRASRLPEEQGEATTT